MQSIAIDSAGRDEFKRDSGSPKAAPCLHLGGSAHRGAYYVPAGLTFDRQIEKARSRLSLYANFILLTKFPVEA